MLEIKESVVERLKEYCQTKGNEIGGILTGSIISDNKYRVSNVSEPCTELKMSNRYSCIRDALIANNFIYEDFEVSDHTRIYIGEWHTHPEDHPMPSAVDINSIAEIYNKSDIVIDGVILIIVGLNTNYYGFYDGKTMQKVEVKII